MIFADKLTQLRKKAGWSQEELAEQMNVTRQSVSKWEGAQSVPDLEKILRLSELFGVSTDYLLKDEIEDVECYTSSNEASALRRVSIEEANAFLSVKAKTSKSIAIATFLCIVSPVCLFLLGAMSEVPEYGLKENVAGGIGMIILIILITIAAAIFISSGRKTAAYGYLVTMDENNDLLFMKMLSVSFVFIGIGVVFFVRSGIVWASYEKLLQEGDYTKEKKKNSTVIEAISVTYWLIATAIYLGYSFLTNNWEISWIVWVVAGVAFPAVMSISNLINRQKGE